MRKIGVFMLVSADGYYERLDHSFDWPVSDAENYQFSLEQRGKSDLYLFGRKTYEMMAGWWPSPAAVKNSPEMAEQMNETPKLVVSRTLKEASWQNTHLVSENALEELRRIKALPGKDITVLGSSDLCVFLLENKLLDEARLQVSPVLLGEGKPLFAGLKRTIRLELEGTRTFRNGCVLLDYRVKY